MSNLKYTCLFGGGAIRGAAYVGAMRAMEELGIEYDMLGGSSVGSIFAALVACGYKSYEVENIFMKVSFELFNDIHFGFGKNFALSRGERFTEWIDELIAKRLGKKNAKFSDLDKDLVIITTNLKSFTPQEFSRFKTPDFEIAKAIRISSSMPGLMPPFKYNDGELVDGDLQKASPMWRLSEALNNSKSRILEYRLEGDCHNEANSPISFINTIYSCVTDVATDFVTEIFGKNDRYDCIRLNTGGIFFADLNLDKESRRKLIDSGYEQTMNYFRETLPDKKRILDNVYSKSLYFLKQAQKGLKAKNVEEVQWWFGDLFTLLCEYKEMLDPGIYEHILDLKNNVADSVSRLFIFHTRFKNRKSLEVEIQKVIEELDERSADIKLFLQS